MQGITILSRLAHQTIIREKTLIVLDEVQLCERALTSLKYFCEKAPEYHIIVAGSLLGVAVNREQFSFPVGKVDIKTLYPMNMEEFLLACGEGTLSLKSKIVLLTISRCPQLYMKRLSSITANTLSLGVCLIASTNILKPRTSFWSGIHRI